MEIVHIHNMVTKWIIFTFLTHGCMSARILGMFSIPSISHQVVFRPLTRELAARGHSLVILTTDPAYPAHEPHPNITEIDLHDVSYSRWKEGMAEIAEMERNGRQSITAQYEIFLDYFLRIFDIQMEQPLVRELLENKDEHFDLIIIDNLARAAHGLRHRFKAPVIGVSTLAGFISTFELIGSPTHPILYPDWTSGKIRNLSFLDKMGLIYRYLHQTYFEGSHVKTLGNDIIKKHFGEDTPDIQELESQMDLYFINVNPIWDGIRPTPPSVVYIGGSHVSTAKELPEDLKRWMDQSTRGVVYLSLGSNFRSADLREDRVRVLARACSRLPYDVLWKWERDEMPGKPDNVRIEKWLPQVDLLRHKNVKAFITQGGLQSTDEALAAGVPLVGLPLMADQENNVAKYEAHAIGVALTMATLEEEQLVAAVATVVGDDRYRQNVRRMARLLADQPMSGAESAIWWSEYVLRHGGAAHLRSPAAGISSAAYFMLDVLAAALATILCVVASAWFLFRSIRKSTKSP